MWNHVFSPLTGSIAAKVRALCYVMATGTDYQSINSYSTSVRESGSRKNETQSRKDTRAELDQSF